VLSYRWLLLVALVGLGCVSPVPVQAWVLTDRRLVPQHWVETVSPVLASTTGDLDGDGKAETLVIDRGKLIIRGAEETAWESPAGWDVRQAAISDLNRDRQPEAVLMVWRKFAPWPIDRFLPNPGRIADFHDPQGNSCAIILIGWRQGSFRELWAGSALAEPVKGFTTADLDADGFPELVTLDARYTDPVRLPARNLSVWEWNGFGFSLITHQKGSFQALRAGVTASGASQLIVGK